MEYDAQGEDWRIRVQRQLADTGIIFFSPYARPFLNDIPEDNKAREELAEWMRNRKFDLVADRMKQIRAHDLRMTDLSDFIIARIDPKVPTYGTTEELVTSVRMKKPIFIHVVGGKEKTPLWLYGMHPPKYFYDTLDELVSVVRGIDREEIQLSSDRWKLLTPNYR